MTLNVGNSKIETSKQNKNIEDKKMNLTYRGVSYQTSPTYIKPEATNTTATYRGKSYNVTANIENVSKTSFELTYRGIKINSATTQKSAPGQKKLTHAFN